MIPPILHQAWIGSPMPETFRPWQRSFLAHNPDLELRHYDDAALDAFLAAQFPDLAGLIAGMRFPVQKIDLLRWLVLYAHGGIYADLDMECLAPLAPVLATQKALFCIEAHVTAARQRELGYEQPYQIANCMVGAPPRHPFIAAVVERIVANCRAGPSERKDQIEDASGPRALTRCFYDLKPRDVSVLHQIHWLPPDIFIGKPLVSRRIMAVHHFAGTWKDDGRPSLRRRLIERNRLPNPLPKGLFHDFGWG